MQINYEALEIWETIVPGEKVKRVEDRQVMGALMRSVPKEMWRTLGAKKNVKEAWETVKTIKVGADRVKKINVQQLLKEFENIEFKEAESVEDFGMRLVNLVATLKTLGETIDDPRIVKKFLRVLPPRFNQVAVSIEMFCDMKTLSVEELVGRLRVAQDRFVHKIDQITDKAGRLLLTEEDWLEKHKNRSQSAHNHAGSSQGKGKQPHRHDGGAAKAPGATKLTSEGTPRRKGRCRNCGIYGHWAEDCKRPKKQKKEEKRDEANIAVAGADHNPALLLAVAEHVADTSEEEVHLSENKLVPATHLDGVWVLDTGASNHMTGSRAALSYLNEKVRGTVKFGDGSTVEIHGLGSMVIQGRQQEHKVLTDIYYIPKLKSNIVSLGQLEEKGFEISLKNGRCSVIDQDGHTVLISAPRSANRLYTHTFNIASPVCLLNKLDDGAWRWHARFGHLNFRSLRDLGRKNMVSGMPIVDRVEQVCDGCVIGKQHRVPFPRVSGFRASKGLELVHTDLCGQITPQTPGGKLYFLLVVDDYSRFMWVEMLKFKSEALAYFKKIKARAETECESKLKALRTDRGGEFNSTQFSIFCTEHGIKHYTTTPYTLQQNGVVERRNQTVVEMARCMMKSKGIPACYWGEAVATIVYVLNRSPTKSLEGVTPYEAWYGRKPSVSHMKIFGCIAHVKKLGPDVKKLSDRSIKTVFIGYEEGTKGYRLLDPVTKALYVSRDVVFEEDQAWAWSGDSDQNQPEHFTVEYPVSVPEPTTETVEPVVAPGSPAAASTPQSSS
jgi:transposase InsO family protein